MRKVACKIRITYVLSVLLKIFGCPSEIFVIPNKIKMFYLSQIGKVCNEMIIIADHIAQINLFGELSSHQAMNHPSIYYFGIVAKHPQTRRFLLKIKTPFTQILFVIQPIFYFTGYKCVLRIVFKKLNI